MGSDAPRAIQRRGLGRRELLARSGGALAGIAALSGCTTRRDGDGGGNGGDGDTPAPTDSIEEGAITYADSNGAPKTFRCLFLGRRQRDSDGNLLLDCDELGADNSEANRWHITGYYTGDFSDRYCWFQPDRMIYNIYVKRVENTDISDPYPQSTNEGDTFEKVFDNAVSLAGAASVIAAGVSEAITTVSHFPNDIIQDDRLIVGDDGNDDEKWHWDMDVTKFPHGPAKIDGTDTLTDALPARVTASTWNTSSGDPIEIEAENTYFYDNLNCGSTPYSGSSGRAKTSWRYDVVSV